MKTHRNYGLRVIQLGTINKCHCAMTAHARVLNKYNTLPEARLDSVRYPSEKWAEKIP